MTNRINEVITRSNIPANNLKLIQMKFNENDQAEIFGTETQREIDVSQSNEQSNEELLYVELEKITWRSN